MGNNTQKLFYSYPFLSQNRTRVIELGEKGVLCEATVAFPEGGGQQGDAGTLRHVNTETAKEPIPFTDTQKGYGRTLFLKDFPTISADTPIYHAVAEEHRDCFSPGDEIEIRIDVSRRAATTIHHSGLHVMLMGVESVRPGITSHICGCSITHTYGRLDFRVEPKFTQEDVQEITKFANHIIADKTPMRVLPHPEENEAWYWQCLDTVIPCGGTHLPHAGYLGPIEVRRKNKGKGIDRLTATFPNAALPLDLYHAEVPE